jgi:hypothetical protein
LGHAGGGDTEPRSGRFGCVAGTLRAAFGLAAEVALPPLCAACREAVGSSGLCAVCWSKLSFIAPPYCERLGIPFPYDPGPGVLSMEAIADRRPINAPAPRYASTTYRARSSMRSNTATGSTWRPPLAVGWRMPAAN